MGALREARIGEICQLVGFEAENGDRLLGLGLLCAVSIVQQGGVLSIRA